MKARAVIRLKLPSKSLEIAYRALMPEVMKPATTRSRANLKIDGDFLVLNIEAKDTVALRATLNAYLRWISTCITLLQTLEQITYAY